jgi:hypothetical protein
MNSIGATSVSTVPGDSPALTQEAAACDASGSFGVFLQPQMEKQCAALPQQQAASTGGSPKTDSSKEQKAGTSHVVDGSVDMNFLSACLVAMQAPPSVPVTTTLVAGSECVAEPMVGNTDTGEATASNGNPTVAAQAPLLNAVFTAGTVMMTEPVAGKADTGDAKRVEAKNPTAAEQKTKIVSNNIQTAFGNPANVASSTNTPAIPVLMTKQALNGESGQQTNTTQTDSLAPNVGALVLQSGLSSEKIAGQQAVVTPFLVKDQNGEAAKNA